MKRLKQVIEQVKEYEDNNCFELKTSVVLHWLKEIEDEALAISCVSNQRELLIDFVIWQTYSSNLGITIEDRVDIYLKQKGN
jgi:hypothetical protein